VANLDFKMPMPTATFEHADDIDAINKLYRERCWSDGLPIVPPTRERVARMLACTPRKPDELIAKLAPGFGEATVERIAVNAVMAGCDPEYLPLLLAAASAVAEPQFNLQGVEATTNPAAVWLVVNGPIVQQLGINATYNCLGQGTWANATLGRAMRLILQNIGGALPGGMDRATQGQPAKYMLCCGENEGQSPWAPLHVERGFKAKQSTVTVVAVEGTLNMNTHSKQPNELLRVFAECMVHPASNEYCHGGEPWLVLAPEHAEILKAGGLSKRDIKERLWQLTRMPARHLSAKELLRAQASRADEYGDIAPHTLLSLSRTPDDIWFIVAGGPGTHSVYMPCFGNSRAVTRVIEGF
jgi:hypothetical protein